MVSIDSHLYFFSRPAERNLNHPVIIPSIPIQVGDIRDLKLKNMVIRVRIKAFRFRIHALFFVTGSPFIGKTLFLKEDELVD